MVQDMENKMLSQMKVRPPPPFGCRRDPVPLEMGWPVVAQEVYFGKTQETTKRLRYLDGGASRQAGAMLRQAFMEAAGDK